MDNKNQLIKTTFTQTKELEEELNKAKELVNQQQITGKLNRSKIIRLALSDWIQKQKKIQEAIDNHKEGVDMNAEIHR